MAEESTPAVSKWSSKLSTVKPSSKASSPVAAVQHEHSLVDGKIGATAQDGSMLARDPAAMRGAMGTASAGGGASIGTATGNAGPALRETFGALDAGSASAMPTWVHAGAQQAEAGFQDPALGWVAVRADLSGGGVHAALVPGSAEAAQALGGHMAGLNAYLAEQRTPVASLTLAAPEGRWAESGMGQGAGQSMNQGGRQDAGQGASSSRQSSPQISGSAVTTAVGREYPAQAGRAEATVRPVVPGGVHISVMA
jgi:hypothetical protein